MAPPGNSLTEIAAPAAGAAAAGDAPRGGRTLQAIVFDAPDVLYDATLWRRWLFQLVGRLGGGGSQAEFFRAWDEQLDDVHRGRRELAEALQNFLLARGLSWAVIDEVEAASRIQRRNLEWNVRPLPGVARVLEGLHARGWPLFAWADAPYTAAKLAERLERLVPGTPFEAVLTSFDLEYTQPARECYARALAAWELPPATTVYVGHDRAHLAGAAAAGLVTVAVNFEPGAQADQHLGCFDELAALANSWSLCPRRRGRVST